MLLNFKAIRDGRSTQVFRVAPDDALLEGFFGRLTRPLAVTAQILEQPHQMYLVTLETHGEVELSCRRCLTPLRQPIEERSMLVFEVGAVGGGEVLVRGVDAPEARSLRSSMGEIEEILALRSRFDTFDLGPAARETLFLAVERFPLCRPDCRGLCPDCGEDLNRGTCRCAAREATPGRQGGLEKLGSLLTL